MKSRSGLGRAIKSLGIRVFPGIKVSAVGMSVDEMSIVAKALEDREGAEHIMIDVGAHFGSALRPFVELGWRVFAFEPDSENRAELRRTFGDAHGLTIDARAISDVASAGEPFFRSSVSTGISSLLTFHETHERGEDVEVTTLDLVCREFGIHRADVLKVDVEGLDLLVLRGNDWDALVPEIVVCEFEDRKTRKVGYTFDDLCAFLSDRSYHLLVSEWYPVQEYGAKHRFKRVALYPARRRDPNSWGNVIATRSRLLQLRLLARMWIGTGLGRILSPLYKSEPFRS